MADPFSSMGPEASGPIVGEQFLQQSLLNQLGAQGKASDLAMQPLRAQKLRAEVAHSQAETEKVLMELARTKKFTETLSGAQAGGFPGLAGIDPEDPYAQAHMWTGISNLALGVGDVKVAQDAAKTGSTILRNVAAAGASKERTRLAELDVDLKHMGIVSQELGADIQDQAGLDRARRNILERTGRLPVGFDQPFSPALVEDLRNRTLSEKERREGEFKSLQQKDLERYRKVTAGQRSQQIAIAGRRLKLAQQRENRIAATAGSVPRPTLDELTTVESILKREAPGLDDTTSSELKPTIAVEARRRMMANRGLRLDEAIGQTINDLRTSGELETKPGKLWGQNTTFKSASHLGSAGGKFEAGKLYYNDQGFVRKYDPKTYAQTGGWSPIVGSRRAAPVVGSTAAGDDEDDEE